MIAITGFIGVIAMLCGSQADVCAQGIDLQKVYAAVAQIEVPEIVSAPSRSVVLPRQKPKVVGLQKKTNLRVAMIAGGSNKPATGKSSSSDRTKIQIPIIIGAYF